LPKKKQLAAVHRNAGDYGSCFVVPFIWGNGSLLFGVGLAVVLAAEQGVQAEQRAELADTQPFLRGNFPEQPFFFLMHEVMRSEVVRHGDSLLSGEL
jgi:hypothetical protein